ncbi:MAG TPA: hypothetical protein VLH16_03765 [Bacteroidales bacterium]|nr:hypothetical protein [Bacteroidales bacterium]
MKKVDNITVDEFFKAGASEGHQLLFEWLNGKNEFNGASADLEALTFAEVSTIKQILNDPTIEGYISLYEICYKQTPEAFLQGKIIEFAQSNRYILDYVKNLTDTEARLLVCEPDPKWEQAGGGQMNMFGDLTAMIQIGEQFGLPPREVGNWKYSDVFAVMYFNLILSGVQKKYYK